MENQILTILQYSQIPKLYRINESNYCQENFRTKIDFFQFINKSNAFLAFALNFPEEKRYLLHLFSYNDPSDFQKEFFQIANYVLIRSGQYICRTERVNVRNL